MAKKQTAQDRKVATYLAEAEARNERHREAQLAKIKQAISGAQFFDWELAELERLVFGAYGRTKIGAHPQ
jgi:uncharacterized protein HemX